MSNATNRPADLTEGTFAILVALVGDANNWSGMPLFGEQLETRSEAAKGHLTDLKKKGYVRTDVDEDDHTLAWVIFEPKTVALFPSLVDFPRYNR